MVPAVALAAIPRPSVLKKLRRVVFIEPPVIFFIVFTNNAATSLDGTGALKPS
jgi:hypothetical protein